VDTVGIQVKRRVKRIGARDIETLYQRNLSKERLDIVHRHHGLLSVILLSVSHESEATATAGVTILDNNLGDDVLEGE
jgi:hypothetical protein